MTQMLVGTGYTFDKNGNTYHVHAKVITPSYGTPGNLMLPGYPGAPGYPGYPGYPGAMTAPGYPGFSGYPSYPGAMASPGYPGYPGVGSMGYPGISQTLADQSGTFNPFLGTNAGGVVTPPPTAVIPRAPALEPGSIIDTTASDQTIPVTLQKPIRLSHVAPEYVIALLKWLSNGSNSPYDLPPTESSILAYELMQGSMQQMMVGEMGQMTTQMNNNYGNNGYGNNGYGNNGYGNNGYGNNGYGGYNNGYGNNGYGNNNVYGNTGYGYNTGGYGNTGYGGYNNGATNNGFRLY
jgi:hypothetical protein